MPTTERFRKGSEGVKGAPAKNRWEILLLRARGDAATIGATQK
jgi:hypothetical protein